MVSISNILCKQTDIVLKVLQRDRPMLWSTMYAFFTNIHCICSVRLLNLTIICIEYSTTADCT